MTNFSSKIVVIILIQLLWVPQLQKFNVFFDVPIQNTLYYTTVLSCFNSQFPTHFRQNFHILTRKKQKNIY